MQAHVMKKILIAVFCLSTAALLCGTMSSCRKAEKAATPLSIPQKDAEFFHADNDIAMTVRSLADALQVGEPLDSAEYDFEGILTDGQGSPLYTDVQGAPGLWEIDVLDKSNVMIRNVYLGDLLPLDLQNYILQSLRIGEGERLDFTAHDAVSDDETEIVVYDCKGVYLRFEVRAGIAPNGLEGPLLSIIMSSDPRPGSKHEKTCRLKSGKGHKLHVGLAVVDRLHGVAHFLSGLLQSPPDCGKGLLRSVVVLRKMTEENIFQVGVDYFLKESGCMGVVHMADFSLYSCFQVFGVSSEPQHLKVVVGLDDQIIGSAHIEACTLGDLSKVGRKHEAHPRKLNGESHVVGPVVRHFKGRYFQIGDFERNLLEYRLMIVFEALRDAMAFQYPVDYAVCAVETQVLVIAKKRVDVSDMIGMVVGQKDGHHFFISIPLALSVDSMTSAFRPASIIMPPLGVPI